MEHPFIVLEKDLQEGFLVRAYIQPKSSKTEFVGIHDGRLKIRVQAPPLEDRANEELLKFFKKQLKGSLVSLVRGHTSRNKDVQVQNYPVEDFLSLMEQKGIL